MARKLRILVLLSVLFVVAVDALIVKTRSTSWDRTLWVHVYAINGDGSSVSESYIRSLNLQDFQAVEVFINAEAERWGLPIPAIDILYGGVLDEGPPEPPVNGFFLQNVWWSLTFRYWSMRQSWESDNSFSDIDLYVNFFNIKTNPSLRDSVGLQGGMIGIINGFADVSYRGSNHLVVAHELFHTLGALDRYGPDTMPVFPEGYAEPQRKPLYPQRFAEVMGGRIPLSASTAEMPRSLEQVKVGELTAREINWIN